MRLRQSVSASKEKLLYLTEFEHSVRGPYLANGEETKNGLLEGGKALKKKGQVKGTPLNNLAGGKGARERGGGRRSWLRSLGGRVW